MQTCPFVRMHPLRPVDWKSNDCWIGTMVPLGYVGQAHGAVDYLLVGGRGQNQLEPFEPVLVSGSVARQLSWLLSALACELGGTGREPLALVVPVGCPHALSGGRSADEMGTRLTLSPPCGRRSAVGPPTDGCECLGHNPASGGSGPEIYGSQRESGQSPLSSDQMDHQCPHPRCH